MQVCHSPLVLCASVFFIPVFVDCASTYVAVEVDAHGRQAHKEKLEKTSSIGIARKTLYAKRRQGSLHNGALSRRDVTRTSGSTAVAIAPVADTLAVGGRMIALMERLQSLEDNIHGLIVAESGVSLSRVAKEALSEQMRLVDSLFNASNSHLEELTRQSGAHGAAAADTVDTKQLSPALADDPDDSLADSSSHLDVESANHAACLSDIDCEPGCNLACEAFVCLKSSPDERCHDKNTTLHDEGDFCQNGNRVTYCKATDTCRDVARPLTGLRLFGHISGKEDHLPCRAAAAAFGVGAGSCEVSKIRESPLAKKEQILSVEPRFFAPDVPFDVWALHKPVRFTRRAT
jgi:hypothetical protein